MVNQIVQDLTKISERVIDELGDFFSSSAVQEENKPSQSVVEQTAPDSKQSAPEENSKPTPFQVYADKVEAKVVPPVVQEVVTPQVEEEKPVMPPQAVEGDPVVVNVEETDPDEIDVIEEEADDNAKVTVPTNGENSTPEVVPDGKEECFFGENSSIGQERHQTEESHVVKRKIEEPVKPVQTNVQLAKTKKRADGSVDYIFGSSQEVDVKQQTSVTLSSKK